MYFVPYICLLWSAMFNWFSPVIDDCYVWIDRQGAVFACLIYEYWLHATDLCWIDFLTPACLEFWLLITKKEDLWPLSYAGSTFVWTKKSPMKYLHLNFYKPCKCDTGMSVCAVYVQCMLVMLSKLIRHNWCLCV